MQKPNGEYLTVSVVTDGLVGATLYAGIKMPQRELYFKHFIKRSTPCHGVFLGLVHALAQMKKDNITLPVYATDVSALSWVRDKCCDTDWARQDMPETESLVLRAMKWLFRNAYKKPMMWNKPSFGNMPHIKIKTRLLRRMCRKVTMESRPDGEYLVVDAGCRKNPGPVEYRGILMPSGKEYFSVRPFDGTNNLGEFLAIVHGLAQMEKDHISLPIYSDSQTAIGWVKKKTCKTDWVKYGLLDSKHLADRAVKWLMTHSYNPPRKWETKRWGEIPADYGRK